LREQRVAMLTPHGDPLGRIGEPEVGGQCVYIRDLAAHLARRGVRVTAYTRDRGEEKPASEVICDGARVVRLPVGPRRFVPKEEIGPFMAEFAEHVGGELEKDEVLHAHFWDGAVVARHIADGRTWVHASHSLGLRKFADAPDAERAKHVERFAAEKSACEGSTWLVASTSLEAKDLAELYGANPDKICVVPPGVDTVRFAPPEDKRPLKARLGLPEDLPVVATLGRLDPRKGFDLFLRAAGALVASGLKARFVLRTGVGGDVREAEEQGRLASLRDELGLVEHLAWLDILPEDALPVFYGAADVFVLPSRYELFGMVMLEAMACGVPVVATRFGGPAEVIRDGREGLLVDPSEVDELAMAIRELVQDPAHRERMGAEARTRIEGRYSWDVSAEKHEELYGMSGATSMGKGCHAGR